MKKILPLIAMLLLCNCTTKEYRSADNISGAHTYQQENKPNVDDVSKSIFLSSQGGRYVSPEDVANHRVNPNIPLPDIQPSPTPMHTSCYYLGNSLECDTQR